MSAPPSPLTPVPFADTPCTPAQHFRLALLGVVAHILEACADGDVATTLERYPFLADYQEASEGAACQSSASAWREDLSTWEERAPIPLPMKSLIDAGMGRLDLELLLATGLVEEDPRFAEIFEREQGHARRPTLGLLLAWWRVGKDGHDRVEGVRRALLGLVCTGLVDVQNPEAPRPDWVLTVPHALWDSLRGDSPHLEWLKHVRFDALTPFEAYVPPRTSDEHYAALPFLMRANPEQVLLVRGPANNGRKTLLGSVAHALGRSMLVASSGVLEDEPRWRLFGVLCVLLDAMPVVNCDLAAGETRVLPALPFVAAPLGVATARHGAWSSADGRPVVTIEVPLPDVGARAHHWRIALPGRAPSEWRPLAEAARLTSGNIKRAATAAAAFAALAGRSTIALADLQQACRGLQSARLETLATRLPVHGEMHDLSVDDSTRQEIEGLAARCRMREQLAASAAAVAQGNVGVRALLAGQSGTGKTLAARLLAASLGKDLYRVDLASTVNKYLGETEKNLNQAFAAAEELDVVLLLDEGDALMANRTDVGSANDRYANLETNFLLQRIESFDGILLVTSNAADRIDKAFARRMDVVINFRAPDEWRRYEILRTHLGDDHDIDDGWLQQVACRCSLGGGQWRNVVGHARLLALQSGCAIGADQLYASLVREYRKSGGHCPLRPVDVAPRPATLRG
jgi:ATPase family associated with various cellular activities (AAA)